MTELKLNLERFKAILENATNGGTVMGSFQKMWEKKARRRAMGHWAWRTGF